MKKKFLFLSFIFCLQPMAKASDSENSFIQVEDSSEESDSFVIVSDDEMILGKQKINLQEGPTKTLYEEKELFQKCKILVKPQDSLNQLLGDIYSQGGTEKYLDQQKENAFSWENSIFCMFRKSKETEGGNKIALELYKAVECFVREHEGAIEKYECGEKNYFSIFIKNKYYTPDDVRILSRHFNFLEGIQTLDGILNFMVYQEVMEEIPISKELFAEKSEPKKTK